MIKYFVDCEGEFGDGEGEEDGYENCLWESGYWEEDDDDDDNDDDDDDNYH